MGNATKRLLNVVYRFVQAFNRFEEKNRHCTSPAKSKKWIQIGQFMKVAVRDED